MAIRYGAGLWLSNRRTHALYSVKAILYSAIEARERV
jgi:hypothetical protein